MAEEIINLCSNHKRERSMPPVSGLLTYVTYLWPAVGRIMRPVLERKGQRVKRALKLKQRQAEQESSG